MADFIWDPKVLTPQAVSPADLFAMNTSGGRTLTDGEQIVGNDSGFWRLTYSGIRVKTPAQRLEWKKLQAGLLGRAKTILVPTLCRGPEIIATLNQAAAARDVDLQIKVHDDVSTNLRGGHEFSVAERLYRIVTAEVAFMSSNDRVWDVTVVPNLREAIADETQLEFWAPSFRARLETNAEMAGLQLAFLKFGNNPSVTFREDQAPT